MTDTFDLNALIMRLRDEDQRWEAILELKVIEGEALSERLIPYLDDSEWIVRWCLTEKLGDLKDVGSLGVLKNQLEDSSIYVRRHAARALYRYGVLGIPSLVGGYSLKNVSVRQAIHMVLIKMGSKGIKALAAEVAVQNWVVSNRIVQCLYELGTDEAADALVGLLSVKKVRPQLIVLLGLMRCSKAVPSLIKLYDQPSLKRLIMVSLFRIGEEEAYPLIVEALLQSDSYSEDLVKSIINKIGKPILPYLLHRLTDAGPLQSLIIELMKSIKSRS